MLLCYKKYHFHLIHKQFPLVRRYELTNDVMITVLNFNALQYPQSFHLLYSTQSTNIFATLIMLYIAKINQIFQADSRLHKY